MFLFGNVAALDNESKVLQLTTLEYVPYAGESLDNQGIIPSIVAEAFKRVDYNIDVTFLPWTEALEKSKVGEYDGILNAWYTPEREEWAVYSDSLPANELVFATLRNRDISFENYLTDLQEYKIGTVKSYAYPQEFIDSDLEKVESTYDDENLERLFSGEVDLILVDKAQTIFYTNTEFSEYKDDIKFLEPSLEILPLYLIVPLAIENHSQIISDFNRGLRQIKADGTYNQILINQGFRGLVETIDGEEELSIVNFGKILIYILIGFVILIFLSFLYLGYSKKGFLISKINKKVLIWFLIIAIIPLVIVSFILLQNQSNILIDNALENANQGVFTSSEIIKEILADFQSDLLILSQKSELKYYLNEGGTNKEELKNNLEEEFVNFVTHKSDYYQLRYIDENGNEIIRVDNDGESIFLVEENRLQNKKERYYFEESVILSKEEVFISPLDLNIEGSELENRGTDEEPIYVPVLRYATPVFNSVGQNKGIIITNIYANSFLDQVVREKREGAKNLFINSEGYFLVHPQKEKEFSFMFEEGDFRIQKESPKSFLKILGSNQGIIYNSEEKVYLIFHRIKMSEKESGILLDVVDKEVLLADFFILRNQILIFGILLVLVIIFLSFLFSRRITIPIKKLFEGAMRFQKRDFHAKVDIKTGDELEDLGNIFNKTAEVLKNMDEEYEQLEKAKTEFLSITSHELRSPMTPMRAQLQMLLGGYFGKLTTKQKNSIDIVERNTSRLDKIIVDFLEISRIEAARLKFKFIRGDPNICVQNLVEEMKGFMPEKEIDIVFIQEKLPIIEHDPDRLCQVLRNLLNNAIKFTPEREKIIIKSKLYQGMILFSVQDKGGGIPKKDQQKIFEPFYQAENMYQHQSGGTGLGLAIVRGIVESQNGKVWFESEVGKGTKFSFTLPLKPVRKVKPIKLLFSAQSVNEEDIKLLFKKILGPIGGGEFESLKKTEGISDEILRKYFSYLSKKGILNEDRKRDFKQSLDEIMGIKTRHLTSSKLLKEGLIVKKDLKKSKTFKKKKPLNKSKERRLNK